MGEPNGSEPPPRSVCQNATLNRSLSTALQTFKLHYFAAYALCVVNQLDVLRTCSLY